MATLQRQYVREAVVEGRRRRYFKWTLLVPNEVIGDLGWGDGTQVEFTAQGGRLVGAKKVGGESKP